MRRPRVFRPFAVLLIFALWGVCPGLSHACLRPTLDDRAIQWSTLIVEARLEQVGEPTPFPAPPATAPATASSDNSARIQVYSFKITSVLDGHANVDERVQVIRLTSDNAAPSRCPATLKNRKAGESFILLLRPADKELASVVKDSMIIVHLLDRNEVDTGALDDLRSLIRDTRQSEAAATDEAIAAQVTALAVASDDVEAEEAEKALLRFGPATIPALRAKLSDAEVSDAGRTRLRHVVDELTPPPLAPQPG